MRIEPTVGRIVDFFPHNDEGLPAGTKHAAIVCGVIDSRTINLAVFSSSGAPYSLQAVQLLQDDDTPPWNGHYAAWMAYQKSQAAKTEKVEAAAAVDLEPVNNRVTELQEGIDAKFAALGEWLPGQLGDLNNRLTALETPPAAPPAPGGEPDANAGGEGKPAAEGTGAAPQPAES